MQEDSGVDFYTIRKKWKRRLILQCMEYHRAITFIQRIALIYCLLNIIGIFLNSFFIFLKVLFMYVLKAKNDW